MADGKRERGLVQPTREVLTDLDELLAKAGITPPPEPPGPDEFTIQDVLKAQPGRRRVSTNDELEAKVKAGELVKRVGKKGVQIYRLP